jgi:putative Mn2+ efflux pump MntP
LIGWAIGNSASQYVESWDHWIAFILLSLLGLRMIYHGIWAVEAEAKRSHHSFLILAITAFSTSIDAMVVGVGLAFIDVNILMTAAAIGIATFTMVTIGFMLGRVMGVMIGKRAEILGGLLLIGVGSFILIEHLQWLK